MTMMSDEPIPLDSEPITSQPATESTSSGTSPTTNGTGRKRGRPRKVHTEDGSVKTETQAKPKPETKTEAEAKPEAKPKKGFPFTPAPPKEYKGVLVRNRHTGRKMHMIAPYRTYYGKIEGIYSDAYDDLIKRLAWRVKHDMQNVIIIDGDTGSGKSAMALNICVDLSKKLKCGFDLSKDYIYDMSDLWRKLDDEYANPINLLDEGTVTIASNTAQEKQSKQFTTLLDTMRSKHWTTIICTPGYKRVNAVVRKDHAEFKIRCASKTHPLVAGYGRGFFECRRVSRKEFDDSNKDPVWGMMYAGVFNDYPEIIKDEYLSIKAGRQDVLTRRYINEAKYLEAKTQKEQDKYVTPEDKGSW